MELLFQDSELVVCIKPVGAQSEEDGKPNCMPALLRAALCLDENTPIFTVHRLDKQVGGVMVYAKTKEAAAALSAQMQAHQFTKEYRAILEGTVQSTPIEENTPCGKTNKNNRNIDEIVPCGTIKLPQGRWEDLLYHDKRKNKVFTVKKERKGVKHAALRYTVLGQAYLPHNKNQSASMPEANPAPNPKHQNESHTQNSNTNTACSLLNITLETGRTHQIRVQSATRKHPLLGDGRYGSEVKGCDIALFSYKIGFTHPKTGERLIFTAQTPCTFPWNLFACETT